MLPSTARPRAPPSGTRRTPTPTPRRRRRPSIPSIDAAKELIGRAVITRNEGPLALNGITRARYDNHDCTVAFQRSPYSEADAKQALKKMPFLKNLAEAKEYIGLKIVNKTEDI